MRNIIVSLAIALVCYAFLAMLVTFSSDCFSRYMGGILG